MNHSTDTVITRVRVKSGNIVPREFQRETPICTRIDSEGEYIEFWYATNSLGRVK